MQKWAVLMVLPLTIEDGMRRGLGWHFLCLYKQEPLVTPQWQNWPRGIVNGNSCSALILKKIMLYRVYFLIILLSLKCKSFFFLNFTWPQPVWALWIFQCSADTGSTVFLKACQADLARILHVQNNPNSCELICVLLKTHVLICAVGSPWWWRISGGWG